MEHAAEKRGRTCGTLTDSAQRDEKGRNGGADSPPTDGGLPRPPKAPYSATGLSFGDSSMKR